MGKASGLDNTNASNDTSESSEEGALYGSNGVSTSFRKVLNEGYQNKQVLVLSDGREKLLVPGVGLLPVHSVNDVNVAKAIRMCIANSGIRRSESKLRRIGWGTVFNVYHHETESARVAKFAEGDDGAKVFWKAISEERLASRAEKRASTPVAADLYDIDE